MSNQSKISSADVAEFLASQAREALKASGRLATVSCEAKVWEGQPDPEIQFKAYVHNLGYTDSYPTAEQAVAACVAKADGRSQAQILRDAAAAKIREAERLEAEAAARGV